MIPGPPALVMIRILSPLGSLPGIKILAISKSSFIPEALITPVCLKAARKAVSEPASAPVWEEAALAPACVPPDFIRMMGFFLVALRATLINLSPSTTSSI
ncbi:hypothetical protein BMS3Abin08_02229 [bacterium BMS3Abin08]|nr:hypothetical protein BMS3Abin08_02229 [bacterium BMS3Abin08]